MSAATARVLSLVVFCGLIGLLLLTPIPYGTVEPWSHAAFACTVFALALVWCLHAAITGVWFGGDVRIFLPLIALILFAGVQSFSWSTATVAGVRIFSAWSADPFETWIFALRLSALTIAGLLAVRFAENPIRLTALVNTIIVIAVLSAIFGIVRLATQHRDGFLLQSLHWGGGFAQFINRNHFAFLAEPAIGLLIALLCLGRNIGNLKLIYLSALILLWAALVMSGSRGGLLAASAQVVAFVSIFLYVRRPPARESAWRSPRLMGFAALLIVMLLALIVGTTVWLGGEQLTTGVQTAATEMAAKTNDHEGARRRDIWRATLRMARAHPFTGVGFGGYWAEIPRYHDASGVLTPQQAHSEYLEILASGGVIGVALFLWFAFVLVQRARRALASRAEAYRVFAIGALIGILGVGIHSLIEFGLHITGNALVFVMLLAVLAMNNTNQQHPAQAHRSVAFN